MIQDDHKGSYFGCGLAGEVGELCNVIKKYERGFTDFRGDKKHFLNQTKLEEELTGSFIYLVLIARYYNIDLEQAILEEVERVNQRDYMRNAK